MTLVKEDEKHDLSDVPLIPDFYKEKSIFITGGTGFIGKALIEKLLYSCSELKTIYLLTRAKKGIISKDRLTSLYSDFCFDRLRNKRPGLFESKVQIVTGDMEKPSLGLSSEDRALLIKTVNIVFHVAASVRFDDHLSKATTINIIGTKQMLDLAYEFQQLESFVHVSTAFSNARRDCIDEVLYPPLGDWRDTIEICKSLDEQTLHILTRKYIEGMENTYVFTKHLAEHMVHEHHGKLPIVIYRPSVVSPSLTEPVAGWVDNFNGPMGLAVGGGKVSPSLTEPVAGWVDNFNGPMGLAVGGGKGILHTVYCSNDVAMDMIPVCSVVKGAIVAAWQRGTKRLEETDEIPIYNACDGGINKITNRDLVTVGKAITRKLPLGQMLWASGVVNSSNSFIFLTRFYLLQLLPAMIIDGLLKILGKKTILIKIQRRIYIAMVAVYSFSNYTWRYSTRNFMDLASRIKNEDRKEFDFTYSIDKYEYFKDCIYGARKYLLKEKDEDIPKHQALHNRFIILNRLLKCLFYGYILWWILQMLYIKFNA